MSISGSSGRLPRLAVPTPERLYLRPLPAWATADFLRDAEAEPGREEPAEPVPAENATEAAAPIFSLTSATLSFLGTVCKSTGLPGVSSLEGWVLLQPPTGTASSAASRSSCKDWSSASALGAVLSPRVSSATGMWLHTPARAFKLPAGNFAGLPSVPALLHRRLPPRDPAPGLVVIALP